MTRVLAFAFRNIARNRVRSFSLIALASVGVCALILIAAGYEFLFSSATAGSVESDGDIFLVRTKNSADSPVDWDGYLAVKERLLSGELVRCVRAEADIEGIVGTSTVSAPCSGSAFEAGETVSLDAVPAVMGVSLARTLGVSKGTVLGGLIADCGMTLVVSDIVKTEAALRDRFYVQIPMDALIKAEANPEIDEIRVWLTDGVRSPSLDREGGSKGYDEEAIKIAGMPELAAYEIRSIPAGNTEVNKIVGVYRTNYHVVQIVVCLTLVLAFLNVLSLSVYERQQELGTLRSMGTSVARIRAMLVAETVMVALISWGIGTVLAAAGSAIINARGGLVFPAPPGSASDIRVGMLFSLAKAAQTGALVLAGAVISAFASSRKLGSASVVEQLEVRD